MFRKFFLYQHKDTYCTNTFRSAFLDDSGLKLDSLYNFQTSYMVCLECTAWGVKLTGWPILFSSSSMPNPDFPPLENQDSQTCSNGAMVQLSRPKIGSFNLAQTAGNFSSRKILM